MVLSLERKYYNDELSDFMLKKLPNYYFKTFILFI